MKQLYKFILIVLFIAQIFGQTETELGKLNFSRLDTSDQDVIYEIEWQPDNFKKLYLMHACSQADITQYYFTSNILISLKTPATPQDWQGNGQDGVVLDQNTIDEIENLDLSITCERKYQYYDLQNYLDNIRSYQETYGFNTIELILRRDNQYEADFFGVFIEQESSETILSPVKLDTFNDVAFKIPFNTPNIQAAYHQNYAPLVEVRFQYKKTSSSDIALMMNSRRCAAYKINESFQSTPSYSTFPYYEVQYYGLDSGIVQNQFRIFNANGSTIQFQFGFNERQIDQSNNIQYYFYEPKDVSGYSEQTIPFQQYFGVYRYMSNNKKVVQVEKRYIEEEGSTFESLFFFVQHYQNKDNGEIKTSHDEMLYRYTFCRNQISQADDNYAFNFGKYMYVAFFNSVWDWGIEFDQKMIFSSDRNQEVIEYADEFSFPVKKIESNLSFIYKVRGGNNFVYFLKAYTENYGIYVNMCGANRSDCTSPTYKKYDKKAVEKENVDDTYGKWQIQLDEVPGDDFYIQVFFESKLNTGYNRNLGRNNLLKQTTDYQQSISKYKNQGYRVDNVFLLVTDKFIYQSDKPYWAQVLIVQAWGVLIVFSLAIVLHLWRYFEMGSKISKIQNSVSDRIDNIWHGIQQAVTGKKRMTRQQKINADLNSSRNQQLVQQQ